MGNLFYGCSSLTSLYLDSFSAKKFDFQLDNIFNNSFDRRNKNIDQQYINGFNQGMFDTSKYFDNQFGTPFMPPEDNYYRFGFGP